MALNLSRLDAILILYRLEVSFVTKPHMLLL